MKKSMLSSWTSSLASRLPHPQDINEPPPRDMKEAQEGDACFITNLATELVQHIIDFVPPSSHLALARTCKHIFACSSDVLKRHHDALIKYGVSSDLDPATIPTLLRSAFGYGDLVLAYQVRSLEIWYDRTSWQEWKTLDLQTPLDEDIENVPITWEYMYGEIENYLACLEHGTDAIANLDNAREQLENGCDGFLKAVLLAHCPRLQDVKFVMPGFLDEASAAPSWLTILIDDAYNSKRWGPGLQNLSTVAVGLPSETWMDIPYNSHTNGPAHQSPNTPLLMSLLRLPSISRIYFRDHMHSYSDKTPYHDLLPEGSSTVQHIFLDNPSDLGYHFAKALTQAPKALLSVSFRGGEAEFGDADQVVKMLGRQQGSSLESLMFYSYGPGTRGRRIHGYRCGAFRPEELNDFNVLKHLCINVQDIELQAFYDEQHMRQDWESDGAWTDRCFVSYFEGACLEALVLWNGLTNNHISWEPTEEQGFEDALIWLMNGTDSKMPDRTLKALYLEHVERNSGPIRERRGRPVTDSEEHIWFRRAVEVGRKRGVDVHTLTNRNPPRHQHEFPEAPDRYSWVTGPWGQRPQELVFDVYSGRRGPRGCGKCGNCEACLALYSKELWDSIAKEPRRMKMSGKDAEVGELRSRGE
jgi:hypothetical protein